MGVMQDEEVDPLDTTLELTPVPPEDEGTPPPGPEDTQSTDAQELQPRWTWGLSYGAVHRNSCVVCSAYMHHLSKALQHHVPLAEDAVRQPELHAQKEYDRGWSDCDQAQMQCDWASARASTPHTMHVWPSPYPTTSHTGITGQTPPICVGTQVPKPDLITIQAVSPLSMVAGVEGGHNSFEDKMRRVTENVGFQGERPGRGSPATSAPTSMLGEICPQALTEMNIIHYEDDTVIIVRGNGRETVISSREWDGDRAPAHIQRHLAAMTTEPVAHAFWYTLQTSNSQGMALHPLIPAGARPCVTVKAMIQGCHALTMIDTGSMGNFIGPAFAMVTRLRTFPLEQQLTLQLGCMGSHSHITHGAHAQLSIGAFSAQIYFDIANIDRYDCILGIPFLWQNAAVIDFGQQILRIGWGEIPMLQDAEATSTRPAHVQALSASPQCN